VYLAMEKPQKLASNFWGSVQADRSAFLSSIDAGFLARRPHSPEKTAACNIVLTFHTRSTTTPRGRR
ncbi:hypothetical protein, partial [Burkholderia cenocepacia]|uniref:hypothetical protein n=1 Tax=Burkholderia cenocepacia TaxID=95486 RepID=UPI002AB60A77